MMEDNDDATDRFFEKQGSKKQTNRNATQQTRSL
jgi:hypothetical protein